MRPEKQGVCGLKFNPANYPHQPPPNMGEAFFMDARHGQEPEPVIPTPNPFTGVGFLFWYARRPYPTPKSPSPLLSKARWWRGDLNEFWSFDAPQNTQSIKYLPLKNPLTKALGKGNNCVLLVARS